MFSAYCDDLLSTKAIASPFMGLVARFNASLAPIEATYEQWFGRTRARASLVATRPAIFLGSTELLPKCDHKI
jgi:hypothetical protein